MNPCSTATPVTCLQGIHRAVIEWFERCGRDLPWREPACSPWGVLVSEVMLQQTPVVRVLPVWWQWLRRWPTPADLAAEPSGEAVRAWGRLGYPRRALRLHAAVRAITHEHGGRVPSEHDQLLALPGIGGYTAAAVAVFAFGRRHAVVDTNVRRVEARLFSGTALPAKSLTAAENRLAAELLPEDTAGSVAWNKAVMELGALVCTARSPRCQECPVAQECAWRAAGYPEPDYVPRGQAWHGTDRQVRGAIMAVLRSSSEPVAVPLLLADRASSEQLAVSLPRPDDAVIASLDVLWALPAPREQRERALAGLVDDGLTHRSGDEASLPR